MNGYERRKEGVRQRIIKAALELFKEHGFEKVSLNEIARRAAVAHTTIYNHFGSREKLIHEALKHIMHGWKEKYEPVMNDDIPFREKWAAILTDKTQLLQGYNQEFIQALYQKYPSIRETFNVLYTEYFYKFLEKFLEQGKREGYFNPELSNRAIIMYFELIRRAYDASPEIMAEMGKDLQLAQEMGKIVWFGFGSQKIAEIKDIFNTIMKGKE